MEKLKSDTVWKGLRMPKWEIFYLSEAPPILRGLPSESQDGAEMLINTSQKSLEEVE